MRNDVWNERRKRCECFPLEFFQHFHIQHLPIYLSQSLCHSTKCTIAGLCIFNKFRRESPFAKLVISDGGQAKAAFRLPCNQCPHVYLCAKSSQSSSVLPPHPYHSFSVLLALRPILPILHSLPSSSLSFSLPPPPFPQYNCIFVSLAFEQLASFSSVFLVPVFFFGLSLFSSHPLPALSRALYLGAVSIRVWNMDNRTTRVY